MKSNCPALRRGCAAFVVALAVSISLACASTHFDRYRLTRLTEAGLTFRVEYQAENEWDAALVQSLIVASSEKASQWGDFRYPVTIKIHPSHRALERALNTSDLPWLRAWAFYDKIHVQAPSTWGFVDRKKETSRLLTHELTHIAMLHALGDREIIQNCPVPIWFAEGLASVTAGQQDLRLDRAGLASYYLGPHYVGNPISDCADMMNSHPGLVYSAGHWMLVDLIERFGKPKIRSFLHEISMGKSFREAWLESFGQHLAAFEDDWLKSLLDSESAAARP